MGDKILVGQDTMHQLCQYPVPLQRIPLAFVPLESIISQKPNTQPSIYHEPIFLSPLAIFVSPYPLLQTASKYMIYYDDKKQQFCHAHSPVNNDNVLFLCGTLILLPAIYVCMFVSKLQRGKREL